MRVLKRSLLILGLPLWVAQSAQADTVSDDFTQATNSNNWSAQAYACLTAGTTSNNTTSNSNIPGCNYTTPDKAGSGALRLTPASGNQHGAIVSNYTYPSTQGLDVTFTTYSYGGSKDGLASEGADGISFFLMDGSYPVSYPVTQGTNTTQTQNLGSWGGSLAYSCSNVNGPYIGMTGGYLGLGIDEFGNFLNGGSGNDNTASGIAVQTSDNGNGSNSFTKGSYMQANRIGLRGAGNVSWYWLNTNYPSQYPSSLSDANRQAAVQNACKTGTLWDYSHVSGTTAQTIQSATVSGNTMTVTLNGTPFYANGDSVTFTGLTPVAPDPIAITGASISGSNLTLNVASTSAFAASKQSVTIAGLTGSGSTQPISTSNKQLPSLSGTSLTVYVADTTGYSKGQSNVTFTGLTATSNKKSVPLNGPYTISSVNSSNGQVVLTVPSGYSSPSASSAVITNPDASVSLNGTYTVASQAATSFTVVKNGALPVSVTASSTATATLPAGNISGSYTISNVNIAANTSFTVTLNSSPSSITNSSGTATNSTQSSVKDLKITSLGTGPTLKDYPAIPNGYYVLPATNKIANQNTTTRDGAWPITYRLRITPAGILNFYYSFNGGAYKTVLSNWKITDSNGPVPAEFRFGFAGSTGGANNVHEITCFTAQPAQSSSGAGANTVQSGKVRTGNQVYLASYDANAWFGSLVSDPITVDASGNASVSSVADWDANCQLTGGDCVDMGLNSDGSKHSVDVQSPSSRTILTWDDGNTTGIPFEWNKLTSSQQTNLTSEDVLDWLRGVRTNEQSATPPGTLRARGGVLGDIVNSSPVWVGPPSKNYGTRAFTDTVATGTTVTTGPETSYADFQDTYATRQNVVYVGANDGMLHGFRAGSFGSDGTTYDTSTNDGKEVIAFMPASIISNSNIVNLSSAGYTHTFYVDATPGYGDLFYNNAWHTWLVGGVGTGGNEIFALDITDPTGTGASSNPKFSENNASTLVKGDWTSSTITNLGCTNAATGCGDNLGNTVGTPLIRRMHNGKWAIIFGNGLSSTSGLAGVYVGIVDSSTGAVSFVWLDTGWTPNPKTADTNGIAYVSSADLDGDFITDYLYAGDKQGNVWRFDVTSSDPTKWAVSTFGQSKAAPLFTAKDSSGNRQPITTSIAVSIVLTNSSWRVILGLGTGMATPFTDTSATTYQSGKQTIYGIWDWDMAAWNNLSPSQFASMAEVTTSPYRTFSRSDLNANSSSETTAGYRTMPTSTVCWADDTTCKTAQYGWLYDLPGTSTGSNNTTNYEQLIYNPIFSGGELLLNTTIPPSVNSHQCASALPTGWTMAFNIASGGGEIQNIFPDSNNSLIVPEGGASVVGVNLNGVGTPFVVTVGSKQYAISQTSGSGSTTTLYNPQGGVKIKRISWEQLR